MAGRPLEWRTNLRANLVLWPEVTPNIAALARSSGTRYDEEEILRQIPLGGTEKKPTDTRAVRNSFEVMALSGLMVRRGRPQSIFLTPLGESLFSFILTTAERRFINESNRKLAAEYLIRALSAVPEYRTLWALWRLCGNVLSNEELNRAIARLRFESEAEEAAAAILHSRNSGDPTRIGPRSYEDSKFVSAPEDQRKAMNPLFLLVGGGRLFMRVDDKGRMLEEWATDIIDDLLRDPYLPDVKAGTDPAAASFMSDFACSPERLPA